LDYLNVLWHGLRLDITTAAYLTVIPLLLIMVSLWYNGRAKSKNKSPIQKIIKIYSYFIAVIVCLLFAIDNVLYSYWGFRLDETALFYLQFPEDAANSITWSDIGKAAAVFVPYLTAVIFIYIAMFKKTKIETNNRKIGRKFGQSLIFVLMMPILFIAIRGGVSTATANVGMVYYSDKQKLNHAAINPLFNLVYSMLNAENFSEEFDFYDEPTRQQIFTSLTQYQHSEPLSVLTTQHPNVLIIVLESFTAGVVEAVGGEKGATPHLNELSRQGILFTNCYANSFRTDRGLVSVLNGYIAPPTTSVMKYPSKSQSLPSIAKALQSKGYVNDMLYGGDINFTNMQSYFYGSGYEAIVSDKDFPIAQRLSKWGANDDVTFNYLYNSLLKRDKSKRFLTTFLTLSSHEPFDVPFHHFDDPFVNAAAYTDSCIGDFVKRIEQTPIWKDLLIIFVADHGIAFPKGTLYYEPQRFRIPMLWIGGAVKEPMIISKICNQSDIAATLLAQLGVSYSDFVFSKDVFDALSPQYAIFTYNNGFGFVDSTGFSVYDNNRNLPLMNADSSRISRGKALIQTLYDDLGAR
jgi:phosphoglycerol transferase MdoB-like AlkP superfamily enzyme